MAKVYSWEVKRNPRTYAYIIDPASVTEDENGKAISTSNPQAYIGRELKGDRLQKVIDWVQNPENDYKKQFDIMVAACAIDKDAKNAVFENVSEYENVDADCNNLRGPAGRGIESVRYSHSINGESVYIIKYDDGAEDSFIVRDGKDGKDGIDGAPGAKGDTGVSSKFMMVYTTGKNDEGELITPKRPEGGSYDFLTGKASYPEGWAPNDSGVIPPVWMSSRTFTTSELSTDPEWSTPVQITGENGAPGVDGVSTEFIYKRTTVKPTEVGQLPSENTNGYVPTDWGWTPSPLGVTENDPTEWCCLRKMVKDVGWGPWDGPTIWSQYGVNGQDGDGVQYIYMRNKGELPKNPTPFGWNDPTSAYQDKLLEWVPAIGSYSNHKGEPVTITEEYYWSDNPQDVDAKYQYQWVAVRKYRKGDNGEQMWQPFSNPTLWGKFGENGDNGTSVRTLYALSTSTGNPPTPPEGTTATGDWGSGFPKDYEFGVNVVWGITAELWSHNNEFVDPETGWSEPFLVTGVKGKDGDAINYNSRYFAYGWVDSTPYPLSSTDPDNPGTSLDGKGRVVIWRDYPDTKNIGSDNDERRWYQCDVHINGNIQQIEKYGPVLPCNGRDGSATPGRYTEFRFAVTPTDDEPILVQFNDDGLIIREPKLFNENQTEQWGWFTSDKELPELKSGGAVWEIWATIDGATEEVIIQSDGSGWSGPLRVSGERGQQGIQGPAGLRGVTGIPGAMINPMYCLGTKGRQEKGESFFENGDGYFGSDLWKDDVLPESLTGWYKTPPYSDFLDATSTTEVNSYASITNNVGRVVRYITTKENSGVTEVYYTYYLIEDLNVIKDIKKDVLQQDELNIYIWCTQGKDIWKAGTVGKEEEGDTVQHERIGVDWGDPFRLQGTNGLRGLAGNRGQVVYPMGMYNEEEVYITTDAKAPYVYDPDDGLFYVYNVVGKPWVGKLPTDYQNIKIDKNGKADDGAEYYKYSMDGTYGNWIGDQNGDTPGKNFANHTDKGSRPAWVRFESFQALYTSIGIIANGMIGSAVYNNEFMFSQQGLAADGTTFSTDYEKFLDGYKYDEKGKSENGETKHWYYKGTTKYVSDRNVNPYETKSTTDSTCIHGFQPNVCINFKTGEMWTSAGKVNFDATGAGYIANKNITWTADGQLVIGPLEEYKGKTDETLQNLINDDTALQAINRLNAMGKDGYVSPEEQKTLRQEHKVLTQEFPLLCQQAIAYGMDKTDSVYYSQYNDYSHRYTFVIRSINYYTNSANTITDTADPYYGYIQITNPDTGSTDNAAYGNIAAYYESKQKLQNALISAAEDKAYTKAYDFVTSTAYIEDLTSQLVTTDEIIQSEEKWGLLKDGNSYFSSTSGMTNARIQFKSDGSGQIGNPTQPGIEWDKDGTLFINRNASEGVRKVIGEIIKGDDYVLVMSQKQSTIIFDSIGDGSDEMPIVNIQLSKDWPTIESFQGTVKLINKTSYPLIIKIDTSVINSGSLPATPISGSWEQKFKGLQDSSTNTYITEFILSPYTNCYFDLYCVVTHVLIRNEVYYDYIGITYNQMNRYHYSSSLTYQTSAITSYDTIIGGTKLILSVWKYISTMDGNDYLIITGTTNADKIELHTNGSFSADTIAHILVNRNGRDHLSHRTTLSDSPGTNGLYARMPPDEDEYKTTNSLNSSHTTRMDLHYQYINDSTPIIFNVRNWHVEHPISIMMTIETYSYMAYIQTKTKNGSLFNNSGKMPYLKFFNSLGECGRAYFSDVNG